MLQQIPNNHRLYQKCTEYYTAVKKISFLPADVSVIMRRMVKLRFKFDNMSLKAVTGAGCWFWWQVGLGSGGGGNWA